MDKDVNRLGSVQSSHNLVDRLSKLRELAAKKLPDTAQTLMQVQQPEDRENTEQLQDLNERTRDDISGLHDDLERMLSEAAAAEKEQSRQ